MYRFINTFIFTLFLFISASQINLNAEECEHFKIDASADLVSLYNFRGIDYGDSPAIQPYFSVEYYGFKFFIWGSQALIAREQFNNELVPFNEIDWGVKYKISTPIGDFTPGITLYYCPFENKKFFNLKGLDENGLPQGSQTMNFLFDYYLSDDIPFKFLLDYNFFNNPQNPLYMGISYLVINNENHILEPFIGVAKGTGPGGITNMYSVDENKLIFVNAGFNFTKILKITDSFNIPITSTLAIQPHTEKVWFVLKLSI